MFSFTCERHQGRGRRAKWLVALSKSDFFLTSLFSLSKIPILIKFEKWIQALQKVINLQFFAFQGIGRTKNTQRWLSLVYSHKAENTIYLVINVQLTITCFTGLLSAALLCRNYQQISLDWLNPRQHLKHEVCSTVILSH